MNTRSIGCRVVSWYAGWLCVVFVLFGAFTYWQLAHYLETSLGEALSRRANQIAELLASTAGKVDPKILATEINERYAPERSGRFIRVASDGVLLYVSGKPLDASFDPTTVQPAPVPAKRETLRHEMQPDWKPLLVETLVCQAGDKSFVIEVGASRAPIQAVLQQMMLPLTIGLPAILLIAILGGYALVRRALAPVDVITRTAERISSRNLDERLPVPPTDDELQRLSEALNRMITRLNESFDYTRRFLADASHELRTPLTVIRGELENAVGTPGLPAVTRDGMGSVLEEVDRLARIVEGLFALSRLDAGEAQAERVRFDLGELAMTTTEQMCLLAEDKGVSLSRDISRGVTVEGDRARLKQVVVNLLDNAIKYTPAGGTVTMAVRANAGKAWLGVTDNGMGIPAEALPHLFERFYRVDKARSRDLGGAGLGLSIVKAICDAHNGRVGVASEPGRGSCFSVELPLATADSGVVQETTET
jgi:heavy metal sensor kinase